MKSRYHIIPRKHAPFTPEQESTCRATRQATAYGPCHSYLPSVMSKYIWHMGMCQIRATPRMMAFRFGLPLNPPKTGTLKMPECNTALFSSKGLMQRCNFQMYVSFVTGSSRPSNLPHSSQSKQGSRNEPAKRASQAQNRVTIHARMDEPS